MSVLVVGVSHKTAPIELREKLALPPERVATLLDHLKSAAGLTEAVVLSTCNRFEVYGRLPSDQKPDAKTLSQVFHDLYGSTELESNLYRYESIDMVRHLFRVASGLDSLVVGETEVLGQVKNAYQFAQQRGATGKITNVLFQRALFVGKAVRVQTGISEGSSSVGAVAVQLAERIFGRLNRHKILLLGAGKIAEVTARHLLSQKAGELTVLNRTKSKAETLAALLNGQAGSLDQLEAELHKADIVICSTSAEKPLVTHAMVEKLMHERRMRSLYFIDIAVPRNVELTVHQIENAYVYNVDDLRTIVDENMGQRKKEITAADALVGSLAAEFHEWLKATLEGTTRPLRHTNHVSST